MFAAHSRSVETISRDTGSTAEFSNAVEDGRTTLISLSFSASEHTVMKILNKSDREYSHHTVSFVADSAHRRWRQTFGEVASLLPNLG